MNTIGSRLKEERQLKNLSQEELSQLVGIDVTEQRAFENGKKAPTVEYLNALDQHQFNIGYILANDRTLSMEDLVRLQDCLYKVEDWLKRNNKQFFKESTLNMAKMLFQETEK